MFSIGDGGVLLFPIRARTYPGSPNLFPRYRCATPQIAWTASIQSFIRDFDMVDIRDSAVIEGQLYVRRFEASHMVVLPIVVGQRAQIRAGSVVYGGSKLGQNW